MKLPGVFFHIIFRLFFLVWNRLQNTALKKSILNCCVIFKTSFGRPSTSSDQSNLDFISVGMSSVIKKVLIIIVILEFIAGIQGNGLIVLVIWFDLVKSKNLSLFDFIFACLAVSRIGMIFLLLLDNIRVVFYQEILESQHIIEVIFDFFCNLSNSLSTWCATCLIVFYFLKLSNFSHPFFLWLRWRSDRVVLTILLGFFLSLFFNLLSINFDTFEVSDHLETERNLTWKKHTHKNQYYGIQILLNMGSLIPLVVSLISFFWFIFSLWWHTRQMTCHAEGSGDLNTVVLLRARNTLNYFIIFLAVHSWATLKLIWSYYRLDSVTTFIIIENVAFLYPSIHPFILILGNQKLRQTFASLLRQIESCLKGM